MKIKVDTYKLDKRSKKDVRLKIDMNVEGCNTISCTGVTIQMAMLSYFAARVPLRVTGFLYLSAIIYAIDRTFDRSKYSVDGWSREFEVEIKLPGYEIFEVHKESIDQLLSYLTGDYWKCSYSDYNPIQFSMYEDSDYFDNIKQVNLFSGGLDSLIGAIDFLTDNPDKKLFLASHYDSTMSGPNADQSRILACFNLKFPNQYITFPKQNAVMISPDKSGDTTCRSRSLMFVSIALMVATYKNINIEVPENGSVSLNYPLSISRRTSCSTRTTHPLVLKMLREIFSKMDINVNISNPYEFKTKGEMVYECSDLKYLTSILMDSNSCGKRGRKQFFYDNPKATHCGRCMPCMYRKASLLTCSDKTSYGVFLTTLFNSDKKNKLSDDFFAMLNFLKRDLSNYDIKRELRIAGMGKIERLDEYVLLVHRTREELKRLIIAEGNHQIKQYIGV